MHACRSTLEDPTATVSLLVAGGLIVGGGSEATTVTQNGAHNYAGPKPCPQAGFDSCVNPTSGQHVVQGSTTTSSQNVYEASNVGEFVTQRNSAGSNTATCSLSTTTSGAAQSCAIIQVNDSGPNLIMLAQSATLATGSTALTNVSQSSSQTLSALQGNNTGSNTVKGVGLNAEATQSISQTANSVVNVPVIHTQQSMQLVNIEQDNHNGANSANFSLTRTQNSTATGATVNATPAVTQKQDTGPLPASSDTVCEGDQPANGSVCVVQSADGASGSNFLKVRATDSKDANAKTLRQGKTLQIQGPTPPAQGGWLVRHDVKTPDPGNSVVDLGTSSGGQGVVKNWKMEATGALGGAAPPGERHQYDGIRLGIIGLSPDDVSSFENSTLTAPPGTQQIANLSAVGHADDLWTGRLGASLTSNQTVSKTVDFSGQNINATLNCTQNSPTTCQSLPTSTRTIETTEGSPFSGVVAGFVASADNVPGDFSATIDWGDGTQSAGTIQPANETAGQFVVTGSHTWADECTCPVTVSISSVNGQFTGVAHSTAFVTDAPLTANGRGLSTPTLAFSGAVANFTDANPGNHLGDFSATINWGDGSSSAGTISGPNGSGVYDVSGSHTYATGGSYNVFTLIQDVGGSKANASSVLVTSSASAGGIDIHAAEYSPFSGAVATFSDANTSDTPSDFRATINWGDGSTTGGTISGGNGSFIVSGSHTYNEEGTYTVQTTVTNVHSNAIASTATSRATVSDAPFTLTGRSISQSSTSFNGVLATGTDYENGLSATINWGDGSTTSVSGGSGITPDGRGGFSVSASHTYASTGTKTITITARDTHGATANATTTLRIGTT